MVVTWGGGSVVKSVEEKVILGVLIMDDGEGVPIIRILFWRQVL